MNNLKGKETIIIGGVAAIGKDVEESLPNVVERIEGKDRYATSLELAKVKFKDSKDVYMASGSEFADALIIGPVAAKQNVPILLTRSQKVDEDTYRYIRDSKIKKIQIIGGEKRISPTVVEQFK